MAKQRVINTRFWSDGFVRTKMNPMDRYLFLYFLTNERTNICGAYELPLEIVASETGLDKEMILKMLPRYEGKIKYVGNWVIMPNFIKHQTMNPSVKQGIAREFELLPTKVKDRLYTAWVQSGLLNLTKLNLTKLNEEEEPEPPEQEVESETPQTPPKAKRVHSAGEFSFKEILKKWESGKAEEKVFAFYFKWRKLELLSQVEIDRFKKQYFNSAKIIKEYSFERLEKVFYSLNEKKENDWSLWNVSTEISNKKYG
jgi:hypothetical protein